MKIPLIRNFRSGEEFYQKHLKGKECKNMKTIIPLLMRKCEYLKKSKGINFSFNKDNCNEISLCKYYESK